jgi:hypothetical protein
MMVGDFQTSPLSSVHLNHSVSEACFGTLFHLLRVGVTKGSTRVGAFSDYCHLRIDVELAAEMLCFRWTLDNGQMSQEECL